MKHNTPESLLMQIEALNPGTPVVAVSSLNGIKKITLDEWKQRVSDAGVWLTPLHSPEWLAFSITFYYADSSTISIKL